MALAIFFFSCVLDSTRKGFWGLFFFSSFFFSVVFFVGAGHEVVPWGSTKCRVALQQVLLMRKSPETTELTTLSKLGTAPTRDTGWVGLVGYD